MNVVRPGPLSALRSPSMRSASSWAMASPRPEPWTSSEVKNGSKMRSSALRLMPVPKSVHREAHATVPARRGDDDVGARPACGSARCR